MQGIVTVATDFLTLRRQLLDTPTGEPGTDQASSALVTYGEMKALARVLGVDLRRMNAPDARNTLPPTEHVTITPVPGYDLVLLTIPANDAPGYETPEWSAFLHTRHIVPLIQALLATLRRDRAKRTSTPTTLAFPTFDHDDGPDAA